MRVDAQALLALDASTLARRLQVSAGNPLIGLERAVVLLQPAWCLHWNASHGCSAASRQRPGGLVDYFLVNRARWMRFRGSELLTTLLNAFAAIWPSGLTVAGFPIGDAGIHPSVRTDDQSDKIVPFHKLSQWLTYSLIEPLTWAGLKVAGD